MTNLEWDKIYSQYLENKNILDNEILENIEQLLFHSSIEFITQGCSLLHGFGSEQFCRYLELSEGQIVLNSSYSECWKEPLLIKKSLMEIISEDEDWKSIYESGFFDEMEFQVLREADYSKLTEHQKQKLLKETKKMVRIPAGKFYREASDIMLFNGMNIQITRDFYIGKYAVTNVLWEQVMGKTNFPRGAYPIEQVSWFEAIEFCNKLSAMENLESVYTINGQNITCNWDSKGYRLLTAGEWSLAARGGENYKYAGSDNVDEVAWYFGNSERETHLVGLKQPNGFGLYDMCGNVHEWIWDNKGLGDKLQSIFIGALLFLLLYLFVVLLIMTLFGSVFALSFNIHIWHVLGAVPIMLLFVYVLPSIKRFFGRLITIKNPKGANMGLGRQARGGSIFVGDPRISFSCVMDSNQSALHSVGFRIGRTA